LRVRTLRKKKEKDRRRRLQLPGKREDRLRAY